MQSREKHVLIDVAFITLKNNLVALLETLYTAHWFTQSSNLVIWKNASAAMPSLQITPRGHATLTSSAETHLLQTKIH